MFIILILSGECDRWAESATQRKRAAESMKEKRARDRFARSFLEEIVERGRKVKPPHGGNGQTGGFERREGGAAATRKKGPKFRDYESRNESLRGE